jgi:hypothetical protein
MGHHSHFHFFPLAGYYIPLPPTRPSEVIPMPKNQEKIDST